MVLTDLDVYLFKEGNFFRAYEKLGAHCGITDGVEGASFAVWAPNAGRVSVVGDFNSWQPDRNPLGPRPDGSGIWEGFIGGITRGALYKFHIASRHNDYQVEKADPYAIRCQAPPQTASILWDLQYEWGDSDWMIRRARVNALNAPWCVYEVHLGSWRRVPAEGNRFLTYREMAPALADYVLQMGFTHVELMPIMEHPFYGSWGYQVTGYFAPTARYGTPQDFMYFVDYMHQCGIGVILDWVPSHFPTDAHGLGYFDGTYLYEHADPRQGFHPEWNSSIFNYGRAEVRSFLASNAAFWMDKYHADGLRVDGVASMLYLDYARRQGEWIPNRFGGRENLEAVDFLRALNQETYRSHPDTQTVAEESTAWPMVSRPVYVGGLGFGLKWNMGWMHDALAYFKVDALFRKFQHDKLTFGIWYAFTENFMLPLSHDEVVHGKGSLLGKMPGDEWQQFANLRALYGFMWAHPGKKMLFMGGEFGQRREWQHDESLEWHVLQFPMHAGVQRWIADLNRLYRSEPALHELDFSGDGFEWVDCRDSDSSVISFLRKAREPRDALLVVCNLTPLVRENYRIGVPCAGRWRECLNSDAAHYGGSGQGNLGAVDAVPLPAHGRFQSLTLRLPPLSTLFFKPE